MPDLVKPVLSEKAINLILEFEVGGQANYEKNLKNPIWPQGESGITIGIGYDLGYNTQEVFLQDWQGLDEALLKRLKESCGLKADKAKDTLDSVKDIVIPWEIAWNVFQNRNIPNYYDRTQKAFTGLENLPADAQGALVSLVFNRGASMEDKPGKPSREQMRNIRDLVPKKDLKGIAEQIRAMKDLWKGTSIEKGMARRREAEAVLVEQAV
jgi:GH24 family phage-related lysozyme (muramidase)